MARDLRGFIKILEERGQLKRISALVDPDMEIAEISNRMLQKGGPGLLFENVKGASFPVAVNLMGTVERICWAMNMEKPEELETLGKKLSMLQQPKPPKKISQAIDFGKVLFDVVKAKPGRDFFPPCQQVVIQGQDLDLNKLPLIRPYPGDAGKIITLGLVITKDCETGIPNVGVYRLQLQSQNTMTVHWLSVRGGARHLRKAAERGKKLEVAIALGVDPLIIMAAATPIPVDLSEWLFAGLYGGSGVNLARCKTVDLEVPADSEFVLEGTITPGEVLPDGPFGDHMGYYGGVEDSPLVRFQCMTHRKDPVYLTTFSGLPPKEEAMMAIALNRIYTPILRQQVSEIVDFFLPMEALSYKAAIISIDKAYPGQARRAALAFWSALPQFTYTKFVIVVDKDINVRDPRQVVWAISSKVDPTRDVFILPNTPFDTLDFASEKLGLGGRMGIDATTKIPPETEHEWGSPLKSDPRVAAMVERRWQEYGLADLQLGEVDPNLFGYDMRSGS
ncbi:MAG: UbiD family decarboxylase [Dolichospermum sp.]|jgi:4-hydroxy-3-polyprenylbenzoate decarboxylase|uniref:UbiD family decarboxylase n=1 Tax=Dolichospermum circinale TaxID=109265 RepID=UPI0003F743C9|nr:UbiD family decarboxylase [Dolichospermum circinale]MDB9484329.1 UbiD family decarboxylase [Dolichospermum circinale CS-537/05]MDB9454145.1 UbiD family decarboxylase [Dolichospermum circinale CS-541/06]MDB9464651.1 UbiD family decarboxylase [Dolichospermum circinale CS-541/04]MDB9476967.1 UbiD family decarboxylase [Dolichospermum circinale CS-537/11]MDB9478122.1 UbiD family decarboxylase [Dolichospermum circinale CS-537/03]